MQMIFGFLQGPSKGFVHMERSPLLWRVTQVTSETWSNLVRVLSCTLHGLPYICTVTSTINGHPTCVGSPGKVEGQEEKRSMWIIYWEIPKICNLNYISKSQPIGPQPRFCPWPWWDAGAKVPIISHDHRNIIIREMAQFWFAGPPKHQYFFMVHVMTAEA